MDRNRANKGSDGSHAAAKNLPADAAAVLRQALAGDAQEVLPLLADADDFDAIGKAAETVNAQRRARGRPGGSANRRNAEMFDYLEARGFKAPEIRLMEIVSADPVQLARAIAQVKEGLGAIAFDQVLEIVKLQLKAAAELMPYKFAKRHELKVEKNQTTRHLFVAGRLTDDQMRSIGGGFSLDGGLSNEINDGAVRQNHNVSHDMANPERSQKDGD